MKTYLCAASSNSTSGQTAVNSILSQMGSTTALYQWAPGLSGIIYTGAGTPASPFASLRLEEYLNTMTMVQGGSNSVLSFPTDNFEYGCIKDKTKIAVGIYFLVFLLALLLILTTFYWLALLIIISKFAMVRFARRKSGLQKNIKPVPVSVLSWMLQAARENIQGGSDVYAQVPMKEDELRDWHYTIVDHSQGVARIGRSRGNAPVMTSVVEGMSPKV
jgi:hypothetical protein